jgi:cytochrome c oxidase cbb3-type subunit 3
MSLKILVLLGCSAVGVHAQLISRPVPATDAVDRGKQLFSGACASCHGADARGIEDGAPDLVRSEIALDDEGGDLIGPVLLRGRTDRGMPSFSYTPAQIKDIAAFIRSAQQIAINRGQYTILNVMTGSVEAGRTFFNGAGGCSGCHSPTGDLAGIGGKYPPSNLQTRMLYPRGGRGGQAKPTMVTVRPRSGPAVTGRMEFMDDFTVALRDPEGYYRSFSRESVTVQVDDPLAAHAQLLRRYTNKQVHDVLTYLGTLK